MDSSKYVNTSNYINVKLVQSMPENEKQFIILGEGKEEKQSFTDPKTGLKKDRTTIVLPISNTNTKKMYEWSLGYKAIVALTQELETPDTAKWVGAVIKLLLMPTAQGGNTVSCTLITRP